MPLIDSKTALERFDGDIEIYIDLIDTFLDMGTIDFETVKTELMEGKYPEAAHRIHQLKGAALTLGADQLAHSSALLEGMLRNNTVADALPMLEEIRVCYFDSVGELASIQAALKKQI